MRVNIRMHRSPAITVPRAVMALLLPLALAAGSADCAFAQKQNPTLTVHDAFVLEGNDGIQHAEVEVTLSKSHNKSVSVNYRTADGTAEAGSDYDAVSGTLIFAPGESSQTILVPVRGDRIPEPDEFFFVDLSNAKGAKIAYGTGIVTIWDDEPRLYVSGASEYEGDSGTNPFTFHVSLSHAYDEAVTVNFATQDYTTTDWWTGEEVATVAGVDYVATSGTLTFAPGETNRTITVEVIGNTEPEPTKYFLVELSDASPNAVIDSGVGWGEILDDDGYYDDWDYDSGYDWGDWYYWFYWGSW